MLERVFKLIPTIADLEEQIITIQGNEPYLKETENYTFQAIIALFKVPYMELADKFWNLSIQQDLEFLLHLSRMIDRIFVQENIPYVCSMVLIKNIFSDPIQNPYYIFNQRFRTSEYTNVITFIKKVISSERRGRINSEDNYYIIINKRTPRLLEYIRDHNESTERRKYYIGFRGGIPREFVDSERLQLHTTSEPEAEYVFNEETEYFSNSKNDKILFISDALDGRNDPLIIDRPLSKEEFNTLLPIIDSAIMELLYLRFELPPAARDMLSLSLSNTFTIKERKPGKISIGELEALENNEYNIKNKDAIRAISALAIVGANQEGLRYYSGFTDPRQILTRMQNRYNTNPELYEYPRLMQ